MKQEQVIELCNEAGLSAYSRDGEFSIAVISGCGAEVCTNEIVKLINLVEQVTLERAAKRVETYCIELCDGDKDMQKHYLRSKSTREFYAGAIRNLAKESQ